MWKVLARHDLLLILPAVRGRLQMIGKAMGLWQQQLLATPVRGSRAWLSGLLSPTQLPIAGAADLPIGHYGTFAYALRRFDHRVGYRVRSGAHAHEDSGDLGSPQPAASHAHRKTVHFEFAYHDINGFRLRSEVRAPASDLHIRFARGSRPVHAIWLDPCRLHASGRSGRFPAVCDGGARWWAERGEAVYRAGGKCLTCARVG